MSDDDATGAESPPRGVGSYYRPWNFEDPSPIVYPAAANGVVSNFKIQPNLIAILLVFRGHEEPYTYPREFFSIADTYQVNNTTKDGVRLRLFPFSLKDQAKAWFISLEPVNLERRMGQLAKEVHKREACKLPSYPDLNPKHKPSVPEHVNMVTSLRNGKTYNNDIKIPSAHDFSYDVEDFVTNDKIIVEGKKADNFKSNSELVNDLLKDFPKPPTQNSEATESPKVREGGVSSTITPYPAALEKSASARLAKKGPHSEDMWETFKQYNILPPSLVDKHDLGTLRKTDTIISLADRSTKIPRGILEDVIVKVDDLYYPVDFFVMDTEKLRLNVFNSLNSPISNDCYHIDTIDKLRRKLFDGMTFHEKEEEFQMNEEEFLLSLEETPLQSQQVQQPNLNEVQEYFDCLLVHQDVLLRARGSNKVMVVLEKDPERKWCSLG
nr:hypothetical protein [Tanacetum cinerariifolium]